MKKHLIESIQSILDTFTDLPITFVEMGYDSVIHSNTAKNGLKLIEKLNHSTVLIVTYKYGLPINDESKKYHDLSATTLHQIKQKLIIFNKDLNDKFYCDLFEKI